jgi:hypothetical protein
MCQIVDGLGGCLNKRKILINFIKVIADDHWTKENEESRKDRGCTGDFNKPLFILNFWRKFYSLIF